MTAETSTPPVFCAAHLLASWDECHPQRAFAELAGQDAPSRPDGTLAAIHLPITFGGKSQGGKAR